jgi:hypothetical protein
VASALGGSIVPAAAEQGPLRQMAARIARNREVLGLHYPSDSVAGKTLADRTFTPMIGLTRLTNVVAVAKKEWA